MFIPLEKMKNHILIGTLISICLIVYSNQLVAQRSTESILSIGTRQGVNFSQILFFPPLKQNLTMGYTGGLVVKYVSENYAGIQAEFNYSQRGWTEKLDSTRSYQRILNYYEIPIMSHFIIGKKSTRAFINIGPNLSFYHSGKEEFKLLRAGDTLSYYMRKLDRNFELGLVGGVGVTQITPIGDFQLEFRFHYGLQNIFSANIETGLNRAQNQLYGVTLTYFFIKKDFWAGKGKSRK